MQICCSCKWLVTGYLLPWQKCAGVVIRGGEEFPLWILIELIVCFTGDRAIRVWHSSIKNNDILVTF